MLAGNLARVPDSTIHFFVGTYPNDPATQREVSEVARTHPNVHLVSNSTGGPTSKGQILNFVVSELLNWEKEQGQDFSGIVLHDSEDVVHPQAFDLIRQLWRDHDFVQIPVFSLPRTSWQWVGGTYMDEFAESHTKDLVVRGYLGAAVPSAGVGTAISRELWMKIIAKQGTLLNERSLTEDYELGHHAFRLGARSILGTFRVENEWIATREYFPNFFWQSVRQKTRWTLGIAIQGGRNLGWYGKWVDRYFLWRDRRVVFSNIVGMFGMFALPWIWISNGPDFTDTAVRWLWWVNAGLMLNRLGQRWVATRRVYGIAAALGVFPRWPVGVFINAFASIAAIVTDLRARYFQSTIRWIKTDHELPSHFGEAVFSGTSFNGASFSGVSK